MPGRSDIFGKMRESGVLSNFMLGINWNIAACKRCFAPQPHGAGRPGSYARCAAREGPTCGWISIGDKKPAAGR